MEQKIIGSQVEEFIQSLPPVTQNNSRAIVRSDFRRYAKMGKMGVILASAKYGIDGDYIAGQDDGEPPTSWDNLK